MAQTAYVQQILSIYPFTFLNSLKWNQRNACICEYIVFERSAYLHQL